jgi:hypothetical protein
MDNDSIIFLITNWVSLARHSINLIIFQIRRNPPGAIMFMSSTDMTDLHNEYSPVVSMHKEIGQLA